jgi:hypothetical protein
MAVFDLVKIQVTARCENIGIAILQYSRDQEGCFASNLVVAFMQDRGLTKNMAILLALVDIGFPQRGDAIEQHALGICKNDCTFQTLPMVGRRSNLVDALTVEMIGPLLKSVVIDASGVRGLSAGDHLIHAIAHVPDPYMPILFR